MRWMILLVAMTACAETPARERVVYTQAVPITPSPSPEVAPAAPNAEPWWCITMPDGFGACEGSRRGCELERADFARSAQGIPPCAPAVSAVCFRRADPVLGEVESCQTDAASCRAYRDERIEHSERLGPVVTECRALTDPQHPPADPPRDSRDLRRWWCYWEGGLVWGECHETRNKCNLLRARFVAVHFKNPCALTDARCIEDEASSAGITACAWQERVSCFAKHFNLNGGDSVDCSPTIKICKELRAHVLKDSADDVTVKSDCATRD